MWKENTIYWGKRVAVVAVVAGVVYGFFFAHLGDKAPAQHLVDIWESPTVTQKKSLIAHEVSDFFKDEIDAYQETKAELAEKLMENNPKGHISQEDRKSLDKLIDASVD